MRGVCIVIVLAAGWLANAPSASAAEWRDVAAPARAALTMILDAADVDRLLARAEVRARIAATFAGWDDADDTAQAVRTSDGGVTLKVVIASRDTQCFTRLDASEVGASEPVCVEVVDVTAERSAGFSDGLWQPPPRRPRRPSAAAPGAPHEGPAETILRQTGPRLLPGEAANAERSPLVIATLADYMDFRDGLLGAERWGDPMRPADGIAAGLKDERPVPPTPVQEARGVANLRDPFGPGRTGAKLDLPVPKRLSLSRDGWTPARIGSVDPECQQTFDDGVASATPPRLACFQRVLLNKRLAKNTAHRVASLINSVVPLPLLADIIEAEEKAVLSTRSVHAIWALAWVAWVDDDVARRPVALAALDDTERNFVRRRLWRWWVKPSLGPLQTTITALYEHHFLGLYPEAATVHGMPKRSFFSDTWLWASNWLTEADRRADRVVLAAYDGLGSRERAVIDAFVGDVQIAQRFPRCASLLAMNAR